MCRCAAERTPWRSPNRRRRRRGRLWGGHSRWASPPSFVHDGVWAGQLCAQSGAEVVRGWWGSRRGVWGCMLGAWQACSCSLRAPTPHRRPSSVANCQLQRPSRPVNPPLCCGFACRPAGAHRAPRAERSSSSAAALTPPPRSPPRRVCSCRRQEAGGG